MKYFWLYVVAVVASLGGLLSGYDTGVISGALLFINESWDLADTTQGILVSSVLIGAVIGAAGTILYYGKSAVTLCHTYILLIP